MANRGNLKEEYLSLLDQNLKEQKYQEFLEENPRLIPNEFMLHHGIHLNLVLRKLKLAEDYTTDFFYITKSSTQYRFVLVEIETPGAKYFNDKNKSFHKDFNKALQQIKRWKIWFSSGNNKQNFITRTVNLFSLHHDPDYSYEIKYVLVHGRREEYSKNSLSRKMIDHEQDHNEFRILSFDSLAEGVDSKKNAYIGVRNNENIDVISHRFIDENLFTWMSPDNLRISNQLRKDIEDNRHKWFHLAAFKQEPGKKSAFDNLKYKLDEVLPKIGVLPSSRGLTPTERRAVTKKAAGSRWKKKR